MLGSGEIQNKKMNAEYRCGLWLGLGFYFAIVLCANDGFARLIDDNYTHRASAI